MNITNKIEIKSNNLIDKYLPILFGIFILIFIKILSNCKDNNQKKVFESKLIYLTYILGIIFILVGLYNIFL
jgi:hypothetical protein